MSVDQSGASGGREELPPRVAVALAAAEIPPSKRGPARRARLSEREQAFYFWILRRFAAGGRPSAAETRTQAERLDLEPDRALATLAREDLIHLGEDGEIAVAYPFSGRATAHRVRFDGEREAYAMCAIDALGIAPMFEQPIEISSQDALSGEEVCGRLTPDGNGEWQPETAVVVCGVIDRQGDSFRGCCPVLNFFATAENAQRWLAQHPDVRGDVVSIADATAAGLAVFGDVLEKT
jgi:hypothetical protein